MAGLFDSVRAAVSARQAAERYGLEFDRSGRRARCIWHSPDRHPSLSFKDDYCRCFSCGGGGNSMNRANEMRPLLDSLRALCRRTACTAILVEHCNKSSKLKAAYRGIGSVDFTNAARSVLMVGYHPQEPGARVCLQIKSNARYGQPIRFSIDDTGRFQWQGVCNVKEDDVLEARRVAVHRNTDPVLLLIRYLLERKPDGWTGTAAQMVAEGSALGLGLTDPRAVGRRLPGLAETLKEEGVLWVQRRTSAGTLHSFRRTSGALPSTSTNDE